MIAQAVTRPTPEAMAPEIKEKLITITDARHVDAGQCLSDAMSGYLDRYHCDAPDRCECRPAWDAAYDELMEGLFPQADAILDEALDRIAALAATGFAGYLEKHPDARLVDASRTG